MILKDFFWIRDVKRNFIKAEFYSNNKFYETNKYLGFMLWLPGIISWFPMSLWNAADIYLMLVLPMMLN